MEAAEKAKLEAEEKAKKEAEEKAKKEAVEKVKREAEEKKKLEAEEMAKKEAAEKAELAAEEKAKKDAEDKAQNDAADKTKRDADEMAKLEAEEKAKREAENEVKKRTEEQARKEAAEKVKREKEGNAKQKSEEKVKKETEENAQRNAKEKADFEVREETIVGAKEITHPDVKAKPDDKECGRTDELSSREAKKELSRVADEKIISKTNKDIETHTKQVYVTENNDTFNRGARVAIKKPDAELTIAGQTAKDHYSGTSLRGSTHGSYVTKKYEITDDLRVTAEKLRDQCSEELKHSRRSVSRSEIRATSESPSFMNTHSARDYQYKRVNLDNVDIHSSTYSRTKSPLERARSPYVSRSPVGVARSPDLIHQLNRKMHLSSNYYKREYTPDLMDRLTSQRVGSPVDSYKGRSDSRLGVSESEDDYTLRENTLSRSRSFDRMAYNYISSKADRHSDYLSNSGRYASPLRTKWSESVVSDDEMYHYSKVHSRCIVHDQHPKVKTTDSRPHFCGRLSNRSTTVGSRVKLTCSVIGYPEPKIEWYKDGLPIIHKKRDFKYHVKLYKGLASLEIFGAQVSDSGNYTCVATNDYGRSITAANIQVFPDYETQRMSELSNRSIESDFLHMRCIRDSFSPRPSSILRDLTHSDHLSAPKGVDLDGDLFSPRSGLSSPDYGRPVVTTLASENFVPAGGTAALHVHFKGTPYSDVTWLKGSTPISTSSSRYRYVREPDTHTLIVSDVTPEETGKYVCRAYTGLGYVDTTATIEVVSAGNVRGNNRPAMFVNRPSTSLTFVVGEDITLSFRVAGTPKPKVSWMKGVKDITNSFRTVKETYDDYVRLTLKRAQPSDAGTYFIVAKNIYGCDRAFVTVRQENYKYRPLNENQTATNHSSGHKSQDILGIAKYLICLQNNYLCLDSRQK
ncbi:unnamed protein product [Bemisia tabaci]|uniref:Ig-like domain-containing protein n=1 Tax=Bemisia tabaci TaxID=7038 RepID=A0A9P0ANW3_BEMTA|nr:unnamed protein product [Bemisia tabaci]